MKSAFKYFFIWVLAAIAGAMIFALPACVVAAFTSDLSAGYESMASNPWVLAIILLGAELVPLFVFWKMKYANFSFKYGYDFGSGFTTQKLFIWAAVGCIGCMLWDLVLANLITFPDWDDESMEMIGSLAANPIGLLIIGLIGPFLEEVVFRGAIERRLLEKNWKPWLAILVSAVFFAVAHGNFTQGLTAIMIGCFLGWVYYRTRSIWPCVFIHALNNTSACLISWAFSGTAYEDADGLPVTAIIAMTVIGVAFLFYAIKYIAQLTKDRTPIPAPVVVPPLPPEATFQPTEMAATPVEYPNEETYTQE